MRIFCIEREKQKSNHDRNGSQTPTAKTAKCFQMKSSPPAEGVVVKQHLKPNKKKMLLENTDNAQHHHRYAQSNSKNQQQPTQPAVNQFKQTLKMTISLAQTV